MQLSDESRTELATVLAEWLNGARKRKRKEVASLVGWLNWLLTVLPLAKRILHPLYSSLYSTKSNGRVHINREFCAILNWFYIALTAIPATHFISADAWSIAEAQYVCYVDASTSWGIGIWIPALCLGLFAQTKLDHQYDPLDIYGLEMLAVLAAVHWMDQHLCPGGKRILIWSDSANTVAAFDTLRTTPVLLPILQCAVLVELRIGCELRIAHIPGAENPADNISRGLLNQHSLQLFF